MRVTTVLEPVSPETLRIVDAHNHVWIETVPGAIDPGPSLIDYRASLAELRSFRVAGGDAMLDCQPSGCGRNGNETNLWPLILRMAEAGLECSVALGTDMTDPALWGFRGGPGFAALPSSIRSHLLDLGIPKPSVDKMLGHNIVARLAGLSRTPNLQET